MKLDDIKKAVQGGLTVHWCNEGYTVENHGGQWVVCHTGGSCQGLTHADGVNWEFGDGGDFYIKDQFSHTLNNLPEALSHE